MATVGDRGNVSPFRELSAQEVCNRLDGPLESVRGLPNEAFTSPVFFELERQRLFTRTWVFAGRLSAIPEAGDRLPVDAAGHPLFIARGRDSTVRAFHNVCPHRGARIVPEPGQAKTIVCPYHAWTFELDGRLRARPHYHGPGQADTEGASSPDAPCLNEVRSAVWADWLFVNLDSKASPFEDYIEAMLTDWREYDLSDIRCAHHLPVDYQCNWKLAIENYSDFYHVFRVHRELDESLASMRRTAMTCDRAVMHNETWMHESYATISAMPEARELSDMGGRLEDGRRRTVFGVIFPNAAVNIHRSDVQFSYFEPLGAERTRLHRWFYFRGETATDERFANIRQQLYEDWEQVLREDEGVCRLVQEGRRSSAYDGGRLAPSWDAGTRHFHQLVARAVAQTDPCLP